METISNTVRSLLENMSDVWVVEWHFDDQGKKHFNVTTLDKHIEHSFICWKKFESPTFHLLAFSDSIDGAHEIIEIIKNKPGGGGNVYPFKKT